MIEIKPDLLINDPFQRKKFKSVTFNGSGYISYREQEVKGLYRAVKKYSKLPPNWREQWKENPMDELFLDPSFYNFAKSLDKISAQDLSFQLFEEAWRRLHGSDPKSLK